MYLIFYILFFSSIFVCFVQCDECVLSDKGPQKSHKEELLKKIKYLSGNNLLAQTEKYTYAVDICHQVSKEHPQAAVTRSLVSNLKDTIVVGRYNNTDIVGKDDWIILTYGSGDRISDNSSCNGTEWKAMILLMCSLDTQTHVSHELTLLEGQSNACMAQFQIMTSLLCPEQFYMSGTSIFFTLFIVGFFLYFVIGITYRRFVLGAKGYEQVPNYTLWASILALPRELMRKLLRADGPRHENLDSNLQRGGPPIGPDAADEPLLRP